MVFRYRDARHPVQQFRRDMDRLMSGLLGGVAELGVPLTGRGQAPLNLWEDPTSIYVELELPGIKSDQLDLSVVGGELSIKVELPDAPQEEATYHRRERVTKPFVRVVRLPSEVDADRVEAELTQGVLTIHLPKSESARPRKIRVGTGS